MQYKLLEMVLDSHFLLKITQVVTHTFWTFQQGFQAFSSPRRGAMSIETGVFKQPHPVGVLCL